MKPGILTLTTDFGIGGPYVAAMKGVLLGLAPETQIVDVCHTISPQNIRSLTRFLKGRFTWRWSIRGWESIAGWWPPSWPNNGSYCPTTG
jgi:hypothetical protein